MNDNLLKNKLSELESLIPFSSEQNSEISTRSVDWHIDHSLKVIIKSCVSVKKSSPGDYKWRFNLSRLFVFTMGFFPRGRSKAPTAVVAVGEISIKDLDNQIEEAKNLVNELGGLPSMSNMNHPYFGVIHVKQVILFLQIHTNHHLKIIKEIIVLNSVRL